MNLKILFGALVLCTSVVLADDWGSNSWGSSSGWDEPAQPAAKPAPQPAAKPAPQPVAQPAPQPAPQPVAQPAPQPAPEVFQPAVEPVAEPAPQPVAQPAPEPVAEPAPQPVAQPAPQPVAQPAPQPVAQPAPQKAQPAPVAVAAAGASLDLKKLTAKDSDDFNEYSRRLQLLTDSITAAHLYVERVESEVKSQIPPLSPKGEFEKAADYEKRRQAYEAEIAKRSKDRTQAAIARAEELEEAAAKISKIQSGMYSVIIVKTVPENATVVLSSSGDTKDAPARFEGVVPGQMTVTVSSPMFETKIVNVELKASEKKEITVALEEQSIFSKEGEINLSELLQKNSTNPAVYKERVVVIQKRISQTDGERSQMMNQFMATYPKLQPQQPGESDSDFIDRKNEWQNEGNRQYGNLIRKCDNYRNRLLRAIEVLEDYMVTVQGEVIRADAPNAKVSIGGYDSEAETFEVVVFDTLDREIPFAFRGALKMPIDKASTFDRNAPFKTEVSYLNFPLKTAAGDRYLAMSDLFLSRGGVPFDVKGVFANMDYSREPNFAEWKAKSDSILAGQLQSRGLTAEYAYGADVNTSEPSEPWTWRAWTRIAAIVLIAGGVGGGVYEHIKASDIADDYNASTNRSYAERVKASDDINKHQTLRNVFYGVAGAGLLAGVLTFVF